MPRGIDDFVCTSISDKFSDQSADKWICGKDIQYFSVKNNNQRHSWINLLDDLPSIKIGVNAIVYFLSRQSKVVTHLGKDI
jgi:hypothetical protein